MSNRILSTSTISRAVRILNPTTGDVQEIQVQRGQYELPEGYSIAAADLALYSPFLSQIDVEGKVIPLAGVQSIPDTPIAVPTNDADDN